jgi:acetylornithine/N-succinyldiaminopimelate aminotransferase
VDPKPLQGVAREKGLLVGVAGDNVLRFAPPLIIEPDHVSQAIAILDATLAEAAKARA